MTGFVRRTFGGTNPKALTEFHPPPIALRSGNDLNEFIRKLANPVVLRFGREIASEQRVGFTRDWHIGGTGSLAHPCLHIRRPHARIRNSAFLPEMLFQCGADPVRLPVEQRKTKVYGLGKLLI